MMGYENTNLSKEDKEFLRYCEFHSETERALFSKEDISKLFTLMQKESPRGLCDFERIDRYSMENIIHLVMIRNSKELWLFPDRHMFSLAKQSPQQTL